MGNGERGERGDRGEQVRQELSARRLLVALRDTGAQPPDSSMTVQALLAAPGAARPLVEPGPGNQTWLPLFTSAEEVVRWRPSVRVLAAPGEQLLALAERLGCSEVVIDPAGPEPVRLPVAGPAGRDGRPASIRPLSTPIGHDVLRRLDRELAGDDDVGRVWLVELALEGEDVLLVCVDVPDKAPADAVGIADALRPRLTPLLPSALYDGVEFRALTDARLAADVAATDAPVYRRRPL
jgi:hypothetical protein